MPSVLKVLAYGVAAALCLYLGWVLLLWVMFRHERPVLVDHLLELAEPEVIDRLEVTDKSHVVLWAIENPGSAQVKTVDYGILPAGFVQVAPVTDNAPTLERGAWVRLSISMPGERYLHVWNQAARKNRFYQAHVQFTGRGCKTPRCDEQFWHWRSNEPVGAL
jgi:hypothetical protein